MWGAIAGDIIGAPWEGNSEPSSVWGDRPQLFTKRSRFTDDTVLTLAVARSLLDGIPPEVAIREAALAYPHAGYGWMFRAWLTGTLNGPYRSYGNGGAMRVSPVAWAYESLTEVMDAAERVTMPTHGHPEGLKGAWAIAGSVFIARTGGTKKEIDEFTRNLGYELVVRPEAMHAKPTFASAAATVPAALRAFLDADSFEQTILDAIAMGGDTDTVAAMAGAIAEPFYQGVPAPLLAESCRRLPPDLLGIALRFSAKYLDELGYAATLAAFDAGAKIG